MIRRLILAGMAALSLSLSAAEPFDKFTAGIEENINTPEVPKKAKVQVAEAMTNLTRTFRQEGYISDGVRGGEVTLITIPISDLFAANSRVLKENALGKLAKLVPYIKRTDKYKVVLAVHSDDTGDDQYAEDLTAERANVIDEYIASRLGGESPVVPYGLGSDEPLVANTSIANRAKNRRVEIYFIPTEEYIEKIRRNK